MIRFTKFQGTGNDFILINDLDGKLNPTVEQIAGLCHRKFGIGADGLMFLRKEPGYDFRMVYYNSDGGESSMCGNGGRCITAFAAQEGLIKNSAFFMAIDGEHRATLRDGETPGEWMVSLKMKDVFEWELFGDGAFLNTGSPHYVRYVNTIKDYDVVEEGRKIRNSEPYKKQGVNVNFIEIGKGFLKVRTYERGVEDETLSCGTGVTAAALTHALLYQDNRNEIEIMAEGGRLSVKYSRDEIGFNDIWLTGPVRKVFTGEFERFD